MTEYIFENRAVAFLDVLGFRETLKEFEVEATKKLLRERNTEFEDLDKGQTFTSPKANEFIDVFLNSIRGLDKERFNYYLFSDNICITINDDDPALLTEFLLVIAELYFAFAEKGYFLRGAVDYGLFINQDTIALARVYELSKNMAITG